MNEAKNNYKVLITPDQLWPYQVQQECIHDHTRDERQTARTGGNYVPNIRKLDNE